MDGPFLILIGKLGQTLHCGFIQIGVLGGAFFLIYADWKEEGFLRATKVKHNKYV